MLSRASLVPALVSTMLGWWYFAEPRAAAWTSTVIFPVVASHALPLTVPYDLVPTMLALYPEWCRVSRRYLRRSLLPELSDPKPYMMEAPRERMRYAQVGAARTVRFVGA